MINNVPWCSTMFHDVPWFSMICLLFLLWKKLDKGWKKLEKNWKKWENVGKKFKKKLETKFKKLKVKVKFVFDFFWFSFFSAHHPDQMLKGSWVSKITIYVKILKWRSGTKGRYRAARAAKNYVCCNTFLSRIKSFFSPQPSPLTTSLPPTITTSTPLVWAWLTWPN